MKHFNIKVTLKKLGTSPFGLNFPFVKNKEDRHTKSQKKITFDLGVMGITFC